MGRYLRRPATTTAPARTVGYTYGVFGNPLVSSVADAAGTVRSTVDLLGRLTTYTDVWDKTTTVAYDQAGRATTTTGPQGVITQAYDPNTSKPSTLTRNGTVLAGAGYDSAGLSVGYDLLGRQNSLSFTGPFGRLVASEVTTSPGGRRTGQLIDTGGPGLVDPNPAGDDLVYDGAGRLTTAFLNGARADYGYAANVAGEGCANPAMGADTNRTAVTVTPTTGPVTVSRSCYDRADRLVSTSTDGGGPVSTAYGYDGHGNATTDAATTLSYDAADRLTGVASATATVTYVRDALDRVVSRTEGATVTRYAHGGFSDAPVAILDAAGAVTQATVPFPGGVTLTVQATGDIWSYPDMAGHLVATTNAAGTRQGTPVTYDPWGAEYPARPPIDNANGNADYGAFGAASKLEEHGIPNPIVLMGARPYSPTEARFLSVDPIEGGCANAYTYVFGDPVNTNDLSGRMQSCSTLYTNVAGNPIHGTTVQRGNYYVFSWSIDINEPAAGTPIDTIAYKLEVNGRFAGGTSYTDARTGGNAIHGSLGAERDGPKYRPPGKYGDKFLTAGDIINIEVIGQTQVGNTTYVFIGEATCRV